MYILSIVEICCVHRRRTNSVISLCLNFLNDRVGEAIEILEHVLKLREEKLGTANPDVDDEKKRLAELLKEAGRSRNRKPKSLENLLVTNSQRIRKEVTRRWSGLGFKS